MNSDPTLQNDRDHDSRRPPDHEQGPDGAWTGLSVVVPSVNALSDVIDCLTALEAQRRDVDLEVLLVDRLGDEVRETVDEHFHWVRVLPVAPGTTIPAMRALAFLPLQRF